MDNKANNSGKSQQVLKVQTTRVPLGKSTGQTPRLPKGKETPTRVPGGGGTPRAGGSVAPNGGGFGTTSTFKPKAAAADQQQQSQQEQATAHKIASTTAVANSTANIKSGQTPIMSPTKGIQQHPNSLLQVPPPQLMSQPQHKPTLTTVLYQHLFDEEQLQMQPPLNLRDNQGQRKIQVWEPQILMKAEPAGGSKRASQASQYEDSDHFQTKEEKQEVREQLKAEQLMERQQLQEIQSEAERLMKKRIVLDYFKELYKPIEVDEQKEQHEKFLKEVLKATGYIIHGEGDIQHVEMDLARKWREEREATGTAAAVNADIGFDQNAFQVAKQLFIQSDLYEDLNAIGIARKPKQGGLTLNYRKEFITQFLNIKRDDLISLGELPSIDQVSLKALGEHRALADRDHDVYLALKENRLKEAHILDYLDGGAERLDAAKIGRVGNAFVNDSKGKDTSEGGSSLDNYMSDDMKNEITEFRQRLTTSNKQGAKKERLELLQGDVEGTFLALRGKDRPSQQKVLGLDSDEIAFALENLQIEIDQTKKEDEEQEVNEGSQQAKDSKQPQPNPKNNNNTAHQSVDIRIQGYIDRLKIRHFEDMEAVDALVRSSAANIEMTKSDYLLALRHIQHNGLLALKEAKDAFRQQMRKMQRVHGVQLKNMELIAVGAAIQMFAKKAYEVKVIFNKEIERVQQDYGQLKTLLCYYEQKIKQLVATNCRQERMVVEAKQYFHHFLRARKEYARTKELARMSLDNLIGSKYASLTNSQYLDPQFDFYGSGIRLQAHERVKIARSVVVKNLEGEIAEAQGKHKQLESNIETLELLVQSAQACELKAKEDMWVAVKRYEDLKERHNRDIHSLEVMIERLNLNFRDAILKKDREILEFREILDMETKVLETIIAKQQGIMRSDRVYIRELEIVLLDELLNLDFTERVNLYRKEHQVKNPPFAVVKTLANEVYVQRKQIRELRAAEKQHDQLESLKQEHEQLKADYKKAMKELKALREQVQQSLDEQHQISHERVSGQRTSRVSRVSHDVLNLDPPTAASGAAANQDPLATFAPSSSLLNPISQQLGLQPRHSVALKHDEDFCLHGNMDEANSSMRRSSNISPETKSIFLQLPQQTHILNKQGGSFLSASNTGHSAMQLNSTSVDDKLEGDDVVTSLEGASNYRERAPVFSKHAAGGILSPGSTSMTEKGGAQQITSTDFFKLGHKLVEQNSIFDHSSQGGFEGSEAGVNSVPMLEASRLSANNNIGAEKQQPQPHLWKNQLFQYPTPPPQQLLSVPYVQQEYDRLVKETMKANEKLLPLLMKRRFDPQTTQDSGKDASQQFSPRSTAFTKNPIKRWTSDYNQQEFIIQVQERYRSRVKNKNDSLIGNNSNERNKLMSQQEHFATSGQIGLHNSSTGAYSTSQNFINDAFGGSGSSVIGHSPLLLMSVDPIKKFQASKEIQTKDDGVVNKKSPQPNGTAVRNNRVHKFGHSPNQMITTGSISMNKTVRPGQGFHHLMTPATGSLQTGQGRRAGFNNRSNHSKDSVQSPPLQGGFTHRASKHDQLYSSAERTFSTGAATDRIFDNRTVNRFLGKQVEDLQGFEDSADEHIKTAVMQRRSLFSSNAHISVQNEDSFQGSQAKGSEKLPALNG